MVSRTWVSNWDFGLDIWGSIRLVQEYKGRS
jgi:hypothetical protein